jgi:hypothetical protein
MKKTLKTVAEELFFVRKYCFGGTYPASDDRCRYIRGKVLVKSSEVSTGRSDPKEMNAVFFCRYPDEGMLLEKARLTSELDQCPDKERRKITDALYAKRV